MHPHAETGGTQQDLSGPATCGERQQRCLVSLADSGPLDIDRSTERRQWDFMILLEIRIFEGSELRTKSEFSGGSDVMGAR